MTAERTRDLILWCAVLAGPIIWLWSFQAKFSWVPIACASQSKLALLGFSLLALAFTLLAGFLAWRQWKELGSRQPDEAADPSSRARFMAVGAMVFSVGFSMVIVAQTVPDLILNSCQ
jgi:hypothetical protein